MEDYFSGPVDASVSQFPVVTDFTRLFEEIPLRPPVTSDTFSLTLHAPIFSPLFSF